MGKLFFPSFWKDWEERRQQYSQGCQMPVATGTDGGNWQNLRSLAYVEAMQKKYNLMRKFAGPRSWCCLLLSQGAAMDCGLPYQPSVMRVFCGVLISRALPRGISLCFTAEQDNNHCTQPLLQRHCVPCWGVPWAVVGLQAWQWGPQIC